LNTAYGQVMCEFHQYRFTHNWTTQFMLVSCTLACAFFYNGASKERRRALARSYAHTRLWSSCQTRLLKSTHNDLRPDTQLWSHCPTKLLKSAQEALCPYTAMVLLPKTFAEEHSQFHNVLRPHTQLWSYCPNKVAEEHSQGPSPIHTIMVLLPKIFAEEHSQCPTSIHTAMVLLPNKVAEEDS